MLTPRSSRQVSSLVRRPLLGFFICASDRPFVIELQVCSLSSKPQVSTTLHYTITVCCNRTAYSQLCLPASGEVRELNLKYTRVTGELTPRPFALAAECISTTTSRLLPDEQLVLNFFTRRKSLRQTGIDSLPVHVNTNINVLNITYIKLIIVNRLKIFGL